MLYCAHKEMNDMSIAYLIGLAVGIAAAVILVVIVARFGARYQDKNRPSEYDERQKAARGKAFQVGFFTLLGYNGLCYLLDVAEVRWCEPMNATVLGIFLSATVFVVTAIRLDAYLKMNENLKSTIWLWALILLCNGVSMVMRGIDGELFWYRNGMLGGDWTNALCFLMAAVALGVQLAHSWAQRKEEE